MKIVVLTRLVAEHGPELIGAFTVASATSVRIRRTP